VTDRERGQALHRARSADLDQHGRYRTVKPARVYARTWTLRDRSCVGGRLDRRRPPRYQRGALSFCAPSSSRRHTSRSERPDSGARVAAKPQCEKNRSAPFGRGDRRYGNASDRRVRWNAEWRRRRQASSDPPALRPNRAFPATFAFFTLASRHGSGAAERSDVTSRHAAALTRSPRRTRVHILRRAAGAYPGVRGPRTRMIHDFPVKAQCSPATTFLIEFKPFPGV
jgi:hypothetical protein